MDQFRVLKLITIKNLNSDLRLKHLQLKNRELKSKFQIISSFMSNHQENRENIAPLTYLDNISFTICSEAR